MSSQFLEISDDTSPLPIKKLDVCPESLIEELKASHQKIIDNQKDLKKMYEAIYLASGIISKVENICQLPVN